ncbi:TOBE domain-containing protein [Thiomicrorhabdus xiamenensis]|nr:TOBE domain-containing protein [Thiomicrorhabdus xiamenensis]
MLVRLQLEDGQKLFAEITEHSAKRLEITPGLELFALIKSVALAE